VDTAQQYAFKAVSHAYTEELDKDYGRLEIRRYWITEDILTLPNVEAWLNGNASKATKAP
jgi:hypothetical protein